METVRGKFHMITCRKCRWLGMNEDRRFGACPKCDGRKFVDNIEQWADKVGWAALISFVAYVGFVALG